MVNVSYKKLNKNKGFFSKSKVSSQKQLSLGFFEAQTKASQMLTLPSQSKEIVWGTPILNLSKRITFLIFSYPNKYVEISFSSKNEKMLKDKIWFSGKKGLKWFSFLPFETPSLLFLPKMGTILFYSSSFSVINHF